MKFGNFLFPDSRDPERDGVVIDETLREAVLSDELGIDAARLRPARQIGRASCRERVLPTV